MNDCEMQIHLRPSQQQQAGSTSGSQKQRILQHHHQQQQHHHHQQQQQLKQQKPRPIKTDFLTKCQNMMSEDKHKLGGTAQSANVATSPPLAARTTEQALQLLKGHLNGVSVADAGAAMAAAVLQTMKLDRPGSHQKHLAKSNDSTPNINIPTDQCVVDGGQEGAPKPTSNDRVSHLPSKGDHQQQQMSSPSSTNDANSTHNSSSSSNSNSPPTTNGSGGGASATKTNGGRLQFFKDGKFILELASSRETENGRTGWVAVPRKIYWPPTALGYNTYSGTKTATTVTTTGTSSGIGGNGSHSNSSSLLMHHKNESSASLSFSDDNSSIQSSPWQREHCWKKSSPRSNISRELCFVYVRPLKWVQLTSRGQRISYMKRRRPYDRIWPASGLRHTFHLMEATSESQSVEKAAPAEIGLKTEVNGERLINEETRTVKVEKVDESMDHDVAVGDEVDGTIKKADIKCEASNGEGKAKDGDNKNGMDEIDSKKTDKCPTELRDDASVDNVDSKMETCSNSSRRLEDETDTKKVIPDGGGDDLKENIKTGLIKRKRRRCMDAIVSLLETNQKALLAKLNACSSSPKLDALMHSQMQQHVSPRKRILREFERVSLDENNAPSSSSSSAATAMKRYRSKQHPPGHQHNHHHQHHHHPNSNGLSTIRASAGSIHSNTFFVPSTITNSQSGSSGINGSISNSNKLATTVNGAASYASTHIKEGSSGSSGGSSISRPLGSLPVNSKSIQQSPLASSSPSATPAKPISSYSIISLLGHKESSSSSSQQQQDQQSPHFSKSSLPPKKKLTSPPSTALRNTWSPSNGGGTALVRNLSSSSTSSPNHNTAESPMPMVNYNMMRSPELSPSPEQHNAIGSHHYNSGRHKSSVYSTSNSGSGSNVATGSVSSFHPYFNVNAASRSSPSDTMSTASDGPGHNNGRYRGSPQYIREARSNSNASPNSRYSPITSLSSTAASTPSIDRRPSSQQTASLPPPAAHRHNISPHITNPMHQPMPPHTHLLHHEPAALLHHSHTAHLLERMMALEGVKEEQLRQMELERYAKTLYSQPSLHHLGLMGAPPPPGLVAAPGHVGFDLAEHAHLIRPSLMSSLYQAYSMYPSPASPSAATNGPETNSPTTGSGGALPVTAASSVPSYYQHYAAAAAMYRSAAQPPPNPLWPYATGLTVPPPPPPVSHHIATSPRPTSPHSAGRIHAAHSASMLHAAAAVAAGAHPIGASGSPYVGGGATGGSPLPPPHLTYGYRDVVALDAAKDDSDVPLNLSKH